LTSWFLDACGLINLYASGHLADLARQQQRPFLLVPTVVQEAGWVFERHGQERGARVPIDLGPLRREGLIEVMEPSAAVRTLFLQLAVQLDDGEAMTIAAAVSLVDAGVVTDDEAAVTYLNALDAPAVTSTLALLREYFQGAAMVDQQEALTNISICARYRPGPRHPEIAWWQDVMNRN
jgi:hypothetical protein